MAVCAGCAEIEFVVEVEVGGLREAVGCVCGLVEADEGLGLGLISECSEGGVGIDYAEEIIPPVFISLAGSLIDTKNGKIHNPQIALFCHDRAFRFKNNTNRN